MVNETLQDIEAKIIRTPLDPVVTFKDDPLRIMRAIRFATQLGFEIEQNTFQALKEMRQRLEIISQERISDELKKKNPHVKTLYGEWDRVFGKVYGDMNTATDDIRHKISERYRENNGFHGDEDFDLKLLIFSIHTYYNIILKLLVSNLFSSLLNPFSTSKTILAFNDVKFKERVIDIMQGESFKIFGIENFFDVGVGVCHQLVVENGLALPGKLLLGSDSHTCSYGAIGAFSSGIDRTEAA